MMRSVQVAMLTGALVGTIPCAAHAQTQVVLAADLAKAVLLTEDGKAAQRKLRQAHRERQLGVRNDEAALMRKKKQLTEAQFEAEVEKLKARIKRSEETLEKMQAKLLEPILARMRALIAAREKAVPTLKVIELTEQPALAMPKTCHLTQWLIKAYAGKKLAAPTPRPECRFSYFLYVDFERVVKLSQPGQDAARRLDGLQKKRQEDLDRRRRMLRELTQKANKDPARWRAEQKRFKEELDRTFKAHQAEVAQRGREAEAQLFKSLERLVEQLSRKTAQGLFIEKLAGVEASLTPNCDVTEALVPIFDGKAKVGALKKGCSFLKLKGT